MSLAHLAEKAAPILDGHDYPRRWPELVGQEAAKRMLQVAAKSARIRKEPLGHVLLSHGTPGIGKTSLAVLIATEMKTTCRVASGVMTRDKARLVFSEMQDRDVLLYDEFHQVMDSGKKNAEWMLSYLQDGVIMGPLGPEEQPRVTIIAATTDAGRIPDSITSRFLAPPLREYTGEEATRIAMSMSGKVLIELPKLGKAEAAAIAAAAHNNPRAIRKLLEVLRDMVITKELPLRGGRYNVDALLEFQGITPDGLDHVAQRYLRALAMEFDGSAGAKALEDRLQQPGGLSSIERVLMDKGLVAKTRTGRTLTQAGIKRFRELLEQGVPV